MNELTFGDIIKEKRTELGLNLMELQALTNIPCSYLQRLEDKRINDPSIDTIIELLLALKIEPSSIPGLYIQEMNIINEKYILATKRTNDFNANNLDNDNYKIATILKKKRKELGLSLKDLEKQCGISASYINRLENNSRNSPSLQTLKKLSFALNIDLNKLPGIQPQEVNNCNINIIELIKKEEISYNGINLSIPEKSKICTLIDYILKCHWNNDSKTEDYGTILNLVDSLKKEKL